MKSVARRNAYAEQHPKIPNDTKKRYQIDPVTASTSGIQCELPSDACGWARTESELFMAKSEQSHVVQ